MTSAPTFSALRAALTERLQTLFERGVTEPRFLLDIACGDGTATAVVIENAHAAFPRRTVRLVGLDRDLGRLLAARRNPAVALVLGDMYEPPFAAGSFDYIVALNIFHGCDRPRLARALATLLPPAGRFLAHDWVPQLYRFQRLVLQLDRDQLASVGKGGGHSQRSA